MIGDEKNDDGVEEMMTDEEMIDDEEVLGDEKMMMMHSNHIRGYAIIQPYPFTTSSGQCLLLRGALRQGFHRQAI